MPKKQAPNDAPGVTKYVITIVNGFTSFINQYKQYPFKIRNIFFPDSVKIITKVKGIFNDKWLRP